MIAIWKIICNFAVENFKIMTINYRHNNVLYQYISYINSLVADTKCKQVKRSKTSERNNTHRSIIFLLFFLCLILLFASCRDCSKYDFKTSSDAISAYRDFHHSVHSTSDVNAEQLAKYICQWQELSDTVYRFIQKDPAFTAHNSLAMDFGLTTDSIRYELIRRSANCSMKDVAYVKINTSPYRNDSVFGVVRKNAMAFFASLDRQPVNNTLSTRDIIQSYRRFLMNTKVHGINDLKQLKEFIQTEDRHFRTFLNHIDQCSEIGVEDITRITEDVCSEIYRSVSDRRLTSEDVMVYMSMRTDRRLLLNAKVCHGLFRKGEVKSASQANAYLWMMIQPYLSMDPFAVAMLSDSQCEMMIAIADDYPGIVSSLAAKGLTDVTISLQIPTQLMRLYISTI